MRLHYADPVPHTARRALGLPTHGICGELVDEQAHNWTSHKHQVECLKCMDALYQLAMRDLSLLQEQIMRLYKHELASR